MSKDTITKGIGSGRFSKWTTLLPLLVFLVIAIFLAIGLTKDPRLVPSPLIGKPVPAFNLPAVQGGSAGLASTDLKGQVVIVNVFASWCVACQAEHAFLMGLSKQNMVPIYGINYKDKPDDAAAWLDQRGNPYGRIGADLNGRVGIDWGVYGVPESFIINKAGQIAYKQIGPINLQVWESTLLPLIRKLQQG